MFLKSEKQDKKEKIGDNTFRKKYFQKERNLI
jgi:hypothetical protein